MKMQLLFNTAVLKIFENIPRKTSVTEPPALIKFETVKGSAYLRPGTNFRNTVFSIFVNWKVCKHAEYELCHDVFDQENF